MRAVPAFRPKLALSALRQARRILLALVFCTLGAAVADAQQSQPANRQVTVQNETDLTLNFLYVFPRGSADRGPDRLGDEMVAPGTTFRARLGRQSGCSFDIVAVWQDGREETRNGVDICRNPRLVFGDPAMPTLEVAVANRSEVVLRELYASSDGGAEWGPDRLGSQVVEPGGGFRLRMRTRACRFDLRAVYADDREEVKSQLDLCAERGVVFDRSGVPPLPRHSLVLVNRHLATVQEVYVSASTDSDWGPERLGTTTLLPVGEEAMVELEGECEADIRIVFPNGGAEERREVNICDMPRIVLTPGWVLGVEPAAEAPRVSAGPPGAATEAEPGPLRLRNAGPLPIVEIYAAPPGEPRGPDRLGADVLGVGETLELEAPDADACAADLVVVFRDGREVSRPGLDLCQGEEIEIR
ncbi:hypothetical protein [Falsiroseomonas tokyonensis]|uniref:Uncharacterized protein n=1 Tax=Falsiroseomonas tokyonensis TaxID=430521 RepID=A0ABV7BRE4_9PROT|nr:hypothetical protein [Falsiroseomonas tokyonensis]MBU8537223.1 hypothetical protein [Falsiroseomonas tokyonensis]